MTAAPQRNTSGTRRPKRETSDPPQSNDGPDRSAATTIDLSSHTPPQVTLWGRVKKTIGTAAKVFVGIIAFMMFVYPAIRGTSYVSPPAQDQLKAISAFSDANVSAVQGAMATIAAEVDPNFLGRSTDELNTRLDRMNAGMEKSAAGIEDLPPVGVGGKEFSTATASSIRTYREAVEKFVRDVIVIKGSGISDQDITDKLEQSEAGIHVAFETFKVSFDTAQRQYAAANGLHLVSSAAS